MDNKNDLREESINFAVAVSDACENVQDKGRFSVFTQKTHKQDREPSPVFCFSESSNIYQA